jgi:DNA-binding response OmpR family regulator
VATRIAILAQDLIWSDRLARAVEAAGAEPATARSAPEFEQALDHAEIAIVDLTARAYDPLAALERARSTGIRVFAVGQHDDLDLRKRALARGAERVYAYRKLFEDGPGTIAGWLASPPVRTTEEAPA